MTEPKYKNGGKYKVNMKVVISDYLGEEVVSSKVDLAMIIMGSFRVHHMRFYDLQFLDPNMETFLGKPLTDSVMLVRAVREDMIDKLNPKEVEQ